MKKDNKPYANDAERDKALNADKSGEGNRFATVNELPDDFGKAETINGGGVNAITVETTDKAKKRFTPAHEVGHSLGLEHWYDGLMKDGPARGEGAEENKITIGMVSRILNYSGIGLLVRNYPDQEWDVKSKDQASVDVHEEGTAPEDFKTGKVEEVNVAEPVKKVTK